MLMVVLAAGVVECNDGGGKANTGRPNSLLYFVTVANSKTNTGWSKKRYPNFIFAITFVNVHRF